MSNQNENVEKAAENKKRNRKTGLIVAVFLAILAVVGIVAVVLNKVHVTEGQKKFTITVISERDDLEKTVECKTDAETLGEYVKTLPDCKWEDSSYGTYIKGWYGYEEDIDNQYWWSVNIDNVEASDGVDMIPLEEGKDYEFILKQGW